MKISNEEQLQEVIKKEITSLIESWRDYEVQDPRQRDLDRAYQQLEHTLYGLPGGAPGMLSVWRKGIVNTEDITIGAMQSAIQDAKRLRSVLLDYQDQDPNLKKAADSTGKLMDLLEKVKTTLIQTYARYGTSSEYAEQKRQKIHDIQSVNEGFLSQLFGYIYTALAWNGFISPSKLSETIGD